MHHDQIMNYSNNNKKKIGVWHETPRKSDAGFIMEKEKKTKRILTYLPRTVTSSLFYLFSPIRFSFSCHWGYWVLLFSFLASSVPPSFLFFLPSLSSPRRDRKRGKNAWVSCFCVTCKREKRETGGQRTKRGVETLLLLELCVCYPFLCVRECVCVCFL